MSANSTQSSATSQQTGNQGSQPLVQYKLSIDEVQQLSHLRLLSGGKKIIAPVEQNSHNQKDVAEYICPSNLTKTDEGMPTSYLEIAMLQLRWRLDHSSAHAPAQSTAVLQNNLACVYALQGRYTCAKECAEESLHNADVSLCKARADLSHPDPLDPDILFIHSSQATKKIRKITKDKKIIENNQYIIDQIKENKKTQQYWGTIGVQQGSDLDTNSRDDQSARLRVRLRVWLTSQLQSRLADAKRRWFWLLFWLLFWLIVMFLALYGLSLIYFNQFQRPDQNAKKDFPALIHSFPTLIQQIATFIPPLKEAYAGWVLFGAALIVLLLLYNVRRYLFATGGILLAAMLLLTLITPYTPPPPTSQPPYTITLPASKIQSDLSSLPTNGKVVILLLGSNQEYRYSAQIFQMSEKGTPAPCLFGTPVLTPTPTVGKPPPATVKPTPTGTPPPCLNGEVDTVSITLSDRSESNLNDFITHLSSATAIYILQPVKS